MSSVESKRRAVSAVMFFPRGGSSHVARALARALPNHGWDVTLVAGSRSDSGPQCDARRFYRDVDLRVVDYTRALGGDAVPGATEAPMHASYEDRPGAPDRVFAALDDRDFEQHVEAWGEALRAAGAAEATALHLHHLTPINEAAARVAAAVPVVGQLHGTELLMLEAIEEGPPPGWRHAERWAERLRGWAKRCERLCVAPGGLERATSLLPVDNSLLVPTPNGFDEELFRPLRVDRAAHWRRHLVEAPQGWAPGEDAGSIRYTEAELAPLAEGVVLIYVGRFTEVKRLSFLIRAFARAKSSLERPAALVLVGGHPGEWEGEHPAETIAATGASDVFLAGWHDHDELPDFFVASDLVMLVSAREQFGQVLVEGMACGLPPIAADSIGPRSIVEDGVTGWLVPNDDEAALADAIAAAVNDPEERHRRAERALGVARERYSWTAVAGTVAGALDEAAGGSEQSGPR